MVPFLDKLVTWFFVAMFGALWVLTRKHEAPHRYKILVRDSYGRQITVDGIRTEFGTHAVAVSFAKQYKESFPEYDFVLKSHVPSMRGPLQYHR